MASLNASNPWEGHTRISDILSDAGSQIDEDEDAEFTYPSGARDYSAQMQELFEGEDSESEAEQRSEDDDEAFLYDGVDANTSVSYRDQLREVLGQDDDGEKIEESLVPENGDEPLHTNEVFVEGSPATSSARVLSPDSRVSSPDARLYPLKLSKPFLHPTVSRLRSFTPQSSKADSNEESLTSQSRLISVVSPATSGFSLSRQSSTTNSPVHNGTVSPDEPLVFKWTELNAITQTIYSKASQKASTLLGAPFLGSPTVLAANGLICIGTTEGKIAVYDFKQTLVCVCDSTLPGSTVGAVTALALSHDHTFVAAGHATGYIQVYDLKHPQSPVRSVAPTTLAVVATGKKEGHLKGSRIVSIGFVAGRHTALVSADDHGLAFFHSLGKVLFVDASDILRILGRYPEPPGSKLAAPAIKPNGNHHTHYTILCMAPLPLGTVAYSTDPYHIVALLTPTKLVIVGLRPTPRTWFKVTREPYHGGPSKSRSKWIGSLAWFPSVSTLSFDGDDAHSGGDEPTIPLLAFSWGNSLYVIKVFESRIKQTVTPKAGKPNEVEIGTVSFEKFGKWTANDNILALQWLNNHQIVLVSRGELVVYDLTISRPVEKIKFDGLSLVVPFNEQGSQVQVNHGFRVYKGKLFFLKQDKFVVGTLLTWADRILSLVEVGDFLQAIELTRSYYTNEAPGNRNNLPTDHRRRREVIGERLKKLMDASAQYAFSEDRMTDETHVSPDGRGVDRTSLFEGMVKVCSKASIALDDFDYLFEDLFQRYDDSGISSIYLRQLEPFVLDNQIRSVPPRITQRLIALHEEDDRPDLIERIIWHIDPSCLDLNQTIQLCQRFHLFDALIYINTRALRDYVAPIVELLGLIRKVQHFRRSREELLRQTSTVLEADASMESTIMNAYKVFPYIANVLSGLSFPGEEPLGTEEAFQAKKDIYLFLFFGRSSVWPPGEGGKLVLTADEEGGVEPTYPYARLLLVFDAESFLHSLDIALEDSYFNDESRLNDRLIIVKIILEIMSSSKLPQDDITMVNIFIARNVAKFFQSFQLPLSTLHNILIGLAEDPNLTTREDRQLAAEYLLSVYNPHDSESILSLFEQAGFYRILRTWHLHERRWAKLLLAYVDDPDVHPSDLLKKVEEVVSYSIKSKKGAVPDDLVSAISKSLPRLLRADSTATAHLLNHRLPSLHVFALEAFGDGIEADNDRYEYLQTLLGLRPNDDDYDFVKPSPPSNQISPELQKMFFTLQCRFHPNNVISTLLHLPRESIDVDHVLQTCESLRVYDAAVWITNWQGQPGVALSKADTFQKAIVREVADAFAKGSKQLGVSGARSSLESLARVSCDICMDYSQKSVTSGESAEDMWFKLLNSQIRNVQLIASSLPSNAGGATNKDDAQLYQMQDVLSTLRSLVQTSFSTLVSITSTSTVSFPRLFKRLVDSTPSATGSHYTEFRIILTGMLESYRSDEDNLVILKHLLDRDVFETVAEVTKERALGWTISCGTCEYCRTPLLATHHSPTATNVVEEIVVCRTGLASHSRCRPNSSS